MEFVFRQLRDGGLSISHMRASCAYLIYLAALFHMFFSSHGMTIFFVLPTQTSTPNTFTEQRRSTIYIALGFHNHANFKPINLLPLHARFTCHVFVGCHEWSRYYSASAI